MVPAACPKVRFAVMYHVPMAIAVTETLLTAEEFYCLPDPPQGGKMELIRGKVVTHMPVSGKHGKRQVQIARALDEFLDGRRLAEVAVETGFIIRRDPDLVLAPDVSVTPVDRLPGGQLPEDSFVDGVPSLAVEVVSPGDSEARVMAKVGEYLEAGVDRVWIVRARTQTVVVFRSGGDVEQLGPGARLTSDHAALPEPGFVLEVNSLFA